MLRTNNIVSKRKLFYSITALAIGAVFVWFGASFNVTDAKDSASLSPSAAFPANAGTLGAIPDGAVGGTVCGDFGAPRDVTFTVSGVAAPLTAVGVTITGTHTWIGDLDVQLIAPNGTTTATIFKQVGGTTATACGSASDFAGPYNFLDSAPATPTFWTAATTTPVPAGNYRATLPLTGAVTTITPAFAGVTTANGTWTLRVRDGGEGDTGSITAATLNLTGAAVPTGPKKNDFDGDGKADYVVVRNPVALSGNEPKMNNDMSAERGARFKNMIPQSAAPDNHGTSLSWFIRNSGNDTLTGVGHGMSTSTDLFVPADYDGDGKSDVAIWRGVSAAGPGGAFFYVLNSSTSTVDEIDFGVTNDNPTVVGDYDGDGKADPAVFRCSFPSTNGQCTYFYKGSSNNPGGSVTYVPFGNNSVSDVFPNRGDFDGDGKLDFCVQRQRPGATTQAQFVLLKSSDGGVEYINWDTSSANIVPGDYDGDGKSDFMTVRIIGGNLRWALLTRTGAESYTNWGTTAITGTTEFIAQSDYDGDGKTDIAVYRRDNNNADNCYYYILRSSDSMLQAFEWGSTTDVPVNGWDVN